MSKPFLFSKAFIPDPEENMMGNVGNVANARENFLNERPTNLEFLLRKRYTWMNAFINKNARGIEIGCGHGLSKLFIHSENFILTDYLDNPWVMEKVDALDMPYDDSSLDYIVSSNMIHHLAKPHRFFNECKRVLKPNGRIIIQEINNSLFMRIILKLKKHEGYSYDVDVFDENAICNNPSDPWSANCAIPNLLFDDRQKFERNFQFKIIHHKYTEFLIFPLSGGVIAKTKTVNLPNTILKLIDIIDSILISISKNVFPLQRQIVLRNDK